MSDPIKHECGIAVVRLRKPLQFYKEKYGTALYGLNKLYLLMEKQHNRGQDGAGIASVKLNVQSGQRFVDRYRSNSKHAISEIFEKIHEEIDKAIKLNPELMDDSEWLKKNVSYTGELLLGHLRYGTYGRNDLESCHPFISNDRTASGSLILAGNFNLTNIEELGWKPDEHNPDTAVVLDRISWHLDKEIEKIKYEHPKETAGDELHDYVSAHIDFANVLKNAAEEFDGGYVLEGLSGLGVAFVMRDPNGIRPCYYYVDDEVVVAASERPAIQTAFNVSFKDIKELTPGHALIVNSNGDVAEHQCRKPGIKKSCSFERIYFSRGSDVNIYEERKMLGRLLTNQVLEAIDYDLDNTVFSFIPNTAEAAFYGLLKGLEDYLNKDKEKEIRKLNGEINSDRLTKILERRVRLEKIAIKDAKLRTFITEDSQRNDLVSHVYDINYGSIRPGIDKIVVLDDSIVRGTTLRQSIIRMLDRLSPTMIVIVSSAPQIRYPDCYGIDMSKMGDFIAFQAAVALLKERDKEDMLEDVYQDCIKLKHQRNLESVNLVKKIYEPFTNEQLSSKIAQLVTNSDVNAEVKVLYQSIENLHKSCPKHLGDWYFSGDYPTAGGTRVVNRAFIHYMEGKNIRAYY
jgi:amidophosphoribosyltransferase